MINRYRVQGDGPLDQGQQLPCIIWFGQIAEYAMLGCRHGIRDGAVCRQYDYRQCVILFQYMMEQCHTIHAFHA